MLKSVFYERGNINIRIITALLTKVSKVLDISVAARYRRKRQTLNEEILHIERANKLFKDSDMIFGIFNNALFIESFFSCLELRLDKYSHFSAVCKNIAERLDYKLKRNKRNINAYKPYLLRKHILCKLAGIYALAVYYPAVLKKRPVKLTVPDIDRVDGFCTVFKQALCEAAR